jgi:hypothetical protein
MEKEYTTIEAVENYPLITIDEAYKGQVTDWIKAMSSQIDFMCGRSIAPAFTDSDVAIEETYLYDGDGTRVMIIKDCCEISSVTVDDVEVEVFKYPANKPYTSRIVLEESSFTKGLQNVAVTGIQAMNPTVPSDIKFACTVLVAGIINNQKKLDKVGTTERIGSYSVTYRDDAQKSDFEVAKKILSGYKRIAL